jgi:hypothetical protein
MDHEEAENDQDDLYEEQSSEEMFEEEVSHKS